MYIPDICERATALSGVAAETIAPFAEVAERRLLKKLGDGAALPELAPELILAGALEALAIFTEAGAARGDERAFTVGGVSVGAAGGAQNAARLRAAADEILAPYIGDGDFCFLGVEGV